MRIWWATRNNSKWLDPVSDKIFKLVGAEKGREMLLCLPFCGSVSKDLHIDEHPKNDNIPRLNTNWKLAPTSMLFSRIITPEKAFFAPAAADNFHAERPLC